MTKENENAPLSADMQALVNQAAALDGESSAQVHADAVVAEVAASASQEVAAMLSVAVAVLSPMLPYLKDIYTDSCIQGIASAYVPVAEKYGWESSGLFAKWGPEIGLAMAVLPAAMQTVAGHKAWAEGRADKDKDKAKEEALAEVVAA